MPLGLRLDKNHVSPMPTAFNSWIPGQLGEPARTEFWTSVRDAKSVLTYTQAQRFVLLMSPQEPRVRVSPPGLLQGATFRSCALNMHVVIPHPLPLPPASPPKCSPAA